MGRGRGSGTPGTPGGQRTLGLPSAAAASPLSPEAGGSLETSTRPTFHLLSFYACLYFAAFQGTSNGGQRVSKFETLSK
jgi:hypothetical protein